MENLVKGDIAFEFQAIDTKNISLAILLKSRGDYAVDQYTIMYNTLSPQARIWYDEVYEKIQEHKKENGFYVVQINEVQNFRLDIIQPRFFPRPGDIKTIYKIGKSLGLNKTDDPPYLSESDRNSRGIWQRLNQYYNHYGDNVFLRHLRFFPSKNVAETYEKDMLGKFGKAFRGKEYFTDADKLRAQSKNKY